MLQPSEQLPGYMAPEGVILDALSALAPRGLLRVDEYAEERRYLNNPGGYTGRYSFEPVPYLREPTRLLGERTHDAVVIVGPGQSAKTTVAENWLMACVDKDPRNFLWYLQSDEARDAYVKQVINEMIREHEVLNRRLGGAAIDNSLRFKRFVGMTVEFLGANRSALINKKAANIVADEIDAYDSALGDVKVLLDVRRQTFFDSMLLAVSHPDLATGLDPARDWNAGIMAMYADSDRRAWYWPCPACGDWSSPLPGARHHMRIAYDDSGDLDAVARSAHFVCPHHGCTLEDKARGAMNAEGRWIGRGETIDPDGTVRGQLQASATAGFWIAGAMSPFVRGGIGGLARARVKAHREFERTGDHTSLKEVMVKGWSFPFSERDFGLTDEIDAEALRAQAGGYRIGTVPHNVRYLLAFVDVQKARFVAQVEGYDPAGNAWLIDRFDVSKSSRRDAEGDAELVAPALYLEDWKLLVEQVVRRRYPLADGSGRTIAIHLCGVDSGGEEGVTEIAYEFYRHLRALDLARQCILTKGEGNVKAPRVRESYPDSGRKDRTAGARGEIPVWIMNSNLLKDGLATLLRRRDGSGARMFFPHAENLPEGFFDEYAAEKRVRGVWEREQKRNEAFDCSYGIRALRLLVGGERINWDAPPAWARPWDENSLVAATAPAPAIPREGESGTAREAPSTDSGTAVSTAAVGIQSAPPPRQPGAPAFIQRLAGMNRR